MGFLSTPVHPATLAVVNAALGGKVSKGDLVLNVRDYGAVGDGTADDTAAIQSAIDYAAPRKLVVFLPAGTYKLTKTTATDTAVRIIGAAPSPGTYQSEALAGCLILRAGASLVGAGPAATVLKTSSGGLSAVVECLDYQDGSIGNLAIEGAGSSNNTAHGLAFSASTPRLNANIRLHDLEIRNVGSYGIGHQYGQPANFKASNIYVHDVGADGIDFKVRYGPLDYLQSGTAGASFSGVLVERFGNRLTDTSGLDIRGQVNLSNITVRDFGRTDGILTGITLSAGIANGVDQRAGSGRSTISGYHIDGRRGMRCIGMDVLSGGAPVIGIGTVRNCTEAAAGGVRIRALSATPYGYIPGPVISGLVVEGSRGIPGVLVERDNVTVSGVEVISDIQTFDQRRGNIVAGQTAFDLWAPIDANTIVLKNGAALTSGGGYTTSGTTLTLTAAAVSTDVIDVIAKGSSAVFFSGMNGTAVGVATDGYTPGVKFSGPTTKATGTVAGNSGAINDPTIFAGNNAGAIEVSVTNAGAADVDLRFNPGNNGLVRFGAWTTGPDAAVNGYITIKDAAGNVRKIPTIA